ncbi:hypothetical protein MNC86_23325, partial [Pantoea agglomerans]|uniref:hypothetical protein n=1 Tax=Enterobacter agglomerans TaxID=549 RepID=UPI001F4E8D31
LEGIAAYYAALRGTEEDLLRIRDCLDWTDDWQKRAVWRFSAKVFNILCWRHIEFFTAITNIVGNGQIEAARALGYR